MAAFNAQPAFQQTFGVQLPNGKYQLEAKWQVALANASKIGIILGLFVGHLSVSFSSTHSYYHSRTAVLVFDDEVRLRSQYYTYSATSLTLR